MELYYLTAVHVDTETESIFNRIALRLRCVRGDWISVDSFGSTNYYQVSTGLRDDGLYKIVSGLDKLPDDGYTLDLCEMDFD